MVNSIPLEIHGYCDARFHGVEEAFRKQLDTGFEVGAAVAAFVDGEAVVDLWAGHRDAGRIRAWERDTIACMMSTGKGMGCLCVLRLVDHGLIALDDPVATYWPEFAQAGKESITIRQVLAHTSGLVFLDALEPGSLFDYPGLRAAAERQRPEWAPGTQPAYHTFTIGILNRELVYRVTGRAIADYWREHFAQPLGVDYQLALNEEEQARCAETICDADDPFVAVAGNLEHPIGRAWKSQAPAGLASVVNTSDWRTWGVPNVGFGNPRGLAKIYGALSSGGAQEGVRLLSEGLLAEACAEAWYANDAVLGVPVRHGLGFLLSGGALRLTGTADTFAGLGAGGYVGVGVPSRRLGFACVGNHMAHALDEGPLSKTLMGAVMECL